MYKVQLQLSRKPCVLLNYLRLPLMQQSLTEDYYRPQQPIALLYYTRQPHVSSSMNLDSYDRSLSIQKHADIFWHRVFAYTLDARYPHRQSRVEMYQWQR